MRAASAALLAALLARAQTVRETTTTLDTRACQPPFNTLPFCDESLSLDARVRDIVSRIADANVAPQLTARHGGGGSPGPASNISAIGLPEWDWGLNAIHGVQSSCVRDKTSGETVCPTSFMNPVNFGATWNRSLFFGLGAVIATETRALWLAGAVEDSDWSGRPHIGLDVWSPNINIAREPRWGRNCEVCSEDPLVNGFFGQLYSQGVQGGEDPNHLKTVVTLKHWDAYSLEDSDGFTRNNFNAIVSPFALADTYWPAFKQSVQIGGAKGVMCSYNAVNGVPTCASAFLTSVLRGTWGFTGYITSDSGALENIYDPFPKGHQYVNNSAEGACVAVRDGTTDVCSGTAYHDGLMESVAQGLCTRADVDAALYRTFMLRMQLGLFDAPGASNPYWSVPLSAVNTPAAQDLNLLATLSSMVLLKHDGATLPFAKGRTIAVIGPHANASAALVGNYLGQLCADNTLNCVVSPFLALQSANAGGSTVMAAGCAINSTDKAGFAAAVALAQSADFVVLALGIDGDVEGESHDRVSIDLPQIQHDLAAAIAAVGKPTAVVLVHGGSIDVSAERDNGAIGAIVDSFYAGTRGAEAIAATLLGDNDHCCGRMAFTTYYANYTSQIKMSEMELDVGVGRGYRYFQGPVVFPFGHGLALTSFSIDPVGAVGAGAAVGGAAAEAPRLRAEAAPSRVLSYSVNVTNTGAVAGDEVVFLFLEPMSMPAQPQSRLVRKLLDFERVHLLPGESQTVTFDVSSRTLALVDRATGDIVSTPGEYDLVLTDGVDATVRHRVVIEGDEVVVEPFPAGGA
jgi:beta-glucosidase-like glycosyl hydrolase